MPEPGRVRGNVGVLGHGVIGEYLKRRAVFPMSGQEQMFAGDVRGAESGSLVDPLTRQVPFRWDGHASKYFLVKSREPFPVFGDQVCMCIFCWQMDALWLHLRDEKAEKYLPGLDRRTALNNLIYVDVIHLKQRPVAQINLIS